MLTLKKVMLTAIVATFISANSFASELYDKFQQVSVTVNSGMGEGSGTIVTREVNLGNNKKAKISFVWTAAHVIDNLRSVRTVVTNGKPTSVVEFKDARIIQELVENGRRVGEIKMDAKVIKYSDSEEGEDLALLMIRKTGFTEVSADFYNDSGNPVEIGTELYHVGSLLGQVGSNSMTRGIVSQVGRVLSLGSGDGVVFDQTTVTAFPGSSGGGIFLSERSGEKQGQYVGMLVRGAGETFNLIVPVRRLRTYAKKNGVAWAVDKDVEVPTMENILSLPIEGEIKPKESEDKKSISADSKKFPVLPELNKATNAKSVEETK